MKFRLQPVVSLMEFVYDQETLPTRIQFRTQELCHLETLQVMYDYVQKHRREGDPPPKDVILEAIAVFQPERVQAARAGLEEIEKAHLGKALKRLGKRQ